MITLAFTAPHKKVVRFIIEERKVRYFDNHWPSGLQIYPMDRVLVKNLALSRSVNLRHYADFIAEANQGKNLEEYNACKNEMEIAENIRRDAKSKGLIEVKV